MEYQKEPGWIPLAIGPSSRKDTDAYSKESGIKELFACSGSQVEKL